MHPFLIHPLLLVLLVLHLGKKEPNLAFNSSVGHLILVYRRLSVVGACLATAEGHLLPYSLLISRSQPFKFLFMGI